MTSRRERRRGTIVMVPAWVSSDGRVTPLVSMETAHLENTIALIRRRGFVTKNEAMPFPSPPCGLRGEFAIDAAEDAFNQEVAEYMSQKVSKSLGVLEHELNKRRRNQK